MIELKVISGVAKGQEIKTSAPFVSIGRSPQHTLLVNDPHVSRHHGEILFLDAGYQYRDLNSTHGTVLRRGNEQNFIKQVVLKEGDELALGTTDNIIQVARIAADPVDRREKSITIMHVDEDLFGPPERVFAHDSKALQTIVQFDSRIISPRITTDRQALGELIAHIADLFKALDYVAILEENDGEFGPYDFTLLKKEAKVRVSSNIIKRARDLERPFLFKVRPEGTLEAEGEDLPLSRKSRLLKGGVEHETAGICAPIQARHAKTRYLQLERRADGGPLTNREVTLVNSLVSRVAERIDNLELVRQNQLLNVNASLGVFAAMIGHDIKNYLFFGKDLSDIRDDPLSEHVGMLRGIERARKLAQGMKELAAPGHMRLKTFSPEELARSVTDEFASLFGNLCAFEVETKHPVEAVTGSEELLSRVMWNLVMNAYHTAENRRKTLPEPPCIRIALDQARAECFAVEVHDNAGGIGPRTLDYMQRSFDLISKVYTREEELMNVVDAISRMEGFTNSVGLFFIAVAVNDMSGTISVTTVPQTSSTFRIELPTRIAALRRLLRV